jgi:hypothetical protein
MSKQIVELNNGTVIAAEDQYMIEKSGTRYFLCETKEEAEEAIEACINGTGWPKEREAYSIVQRQRTVVETAWKTVGE